jgi:hypothetical protein
MGPNVWNLPAPFLVPITMKQSGDNFHFYLTDYKIVRGNEKEGKSGERGRIILHRRK